MKLVYDEWFGELSYAQRAAYRKHNISPADHVDLAREFGRREHAAITKFVKDCAIQGISTFEGLRRGLHRSTA